MKRDIKFRVWSFDPLLEEPEMLQWEDINRLDTEGLMHLCDIIDGTEKNVVLMQYTGLKDKNGKEIYEGDIDRFGYVVGYCESKACFASYSLDGRLAGYPLSSDDFPSIGNIHENPELLKPTSESNTLPK